MSSSILTTTDRDFSIPATPSYLSIRPSPRGAALDSPCRAKLRKLTEARLNCRIAMAVAAVRCEFYCHPHSDDSQPGFDAGSWVEKIAKCVADEVEGQDG